MEKLKYSLTVLGDGWKGRNVDDNYLGVLLSSLQRIYVVGNIISKEAGTAIAYSEKLKMLDTPFGRSCVVVFNLVFAKRLGAVDLLCYVTNPALVRWFDKFYPIQTKWQNVLFTILCKVRMINGQTWNIKDPKTKEEVFATSSLLTQEIKKLRHGQSGSNNEFAWFQASQVHPGMS